MNGLVLELPQLSKDEVARHLLTLVAERITGASL